MLLLRRLKLFKSYSVIFILLVISLLYSCKGNNDKLFTSLSHKKTGIDFRNWVKESENFNVLDYGYLYNGAGVAAGDVNNDGLPDLYFSGNLAKSKLYINKGNLRFEDITEKAGFSGAGTWNTGVTMADINGDGFLDIYVCASTDGRPDFRKNLLYINNGDLTFTESAASYGIDDPSYSTHSIFFDYDKDNDLDLFVINHSLDEFAKPDVSLKKRHDDRFENKLFRNEGKKFTNVTAEAGIITNILNFGLGVAVADFNNDKWPDLYVCNDYFEQDYLYINQHDGTFSNQLEKYFGHIPLSSMGTDAADINNDGFIDLVTLDMDPEDNYGKKLVAGPDNYDKFNPLRSTGFYRQTTRNMMQLNHKGKYFTEIGQYAGIPSTNWSWSPLLCDFDNDGNKDLYISNGYGRNSTHMDVINTAVEQIMKKQSGETAMPRMSFIEKIPATILKNYIFRNNGDLTFSDVTDSWGEEIPSLSNGAIYSDLDNDGDMDIVVNNIDHYAFVYRNNSEKINSNHFLKFTFEGYGLNKGGIGARVLVKCGDQLFVQELMPSRGYMSSVNHELIFGLGKAEIADEVKIIWPDMTEQVLTQVKADQTLHLKNKDAQPSENETITEIDPVFASIESSQVLDFSHVENTYSDFRKQILLPQMLSTQGPNICSADINNDGLEDVFIGGATGTAGKIFIQQKNGTFENSTQESLEKDKLCEDTGAAFFDADNDNDTDLYVVSGGNEFNPGAPELQDRLYLNDGKGRFTRAVKNLPGMNSSGSCVEPSDFDNDGDIDLFVGGRLEPMSYPYAPRSYILLNDGTGAFSDATETICKALVNPGMVTDAVWTDFNRDKKPDLIIVGEWMGIRSFRNDGASFTETSNEAGLTNTEGWWNTIIQGDFDKDGDTDYAAGNLGLNSSIKATVNEPATIYARDFDNNGSVDPVMSYFVQGKSYPFYPKDDIQAQLSFIKKKFPTYESFANATVNEIFSPAELKGALMLKASMFASVYIENKGNGMFELQQLPREAQFSPVYSFHTGDFNGDGNIDLIVAGNFFGSRIQFGEYDANKGLMLAGNGNGGFKIVDNEESGLQIDGEVRDIAEIELASGKKILLFAVNNDTIKLYTTNRK